MLWGSVERSRSFLDELLNMCSILFRDMLDNLSYCSFTSAELLPKSHSLNAPDSLNKTFSNFMSRCAIPLECIYYKADATSNAIFNMVFSARFPGYCSRTFNAVLCELQNYPRLQFYSNIKPYSPSAVFIYWDACIFTIF